MRKIYNLWLLLLCFSLTIGLADAQVRDLPLESALKEIGAHYGTRFVYDNELLKDKKVSLPQFTNRDVEEVLKQMLYPLDLVFLYVEKNHYTIVRNNDQRRLSPSKNQRGNNLSQFQTVEATDSILDGKMYINGRVTDELGEGLPGATVVIKDTGKGIATDVNGHFALVIPNKEVQIIASYIGFKSYETKVGNQSSFDIRLQPSDSQLDEVLIIGYGQSTKKELTGSVGKVSAEVIGQQPISNPLEALQGRVAGVLVTPRSGFGGGNFDVVIRGQNSLLSGSTPLYVVDGVPFSPSTLNQFGVFGALPPAAGSESPLNSINPSDILSIEILKDADATAIYGSRGANGVVLITTKRGKVGKTTFEANVYRGAGQVTRRFDMLNTAQYLELRREAFENDGLTPTAANAPDLLTWDQNHYTDWQDLLIGGTANITDVQATISGGTSQTQFNINGGYRNEGTVYPGDFGTVRSSARMGINHTSVNEKFNINATGAYNFLVNTQVPSDMTTNIFLPPNYNPYNEDGSLNWTTGVSNPLAVFNRRMTNTTRNLMGNAVLSYELLPDLILKSSIGYNYMDMDQVSLNPLSARNPNLQNQRGSAEFGNSSFESYIIEPQISYARKVGDGQIQVLLGSTLQQNVNQGTYISATDYFSEELLENLSAAATRTFWSDDYSEYRYSSGFGRVNYNFKGKYILNGTFRRDGSSKFGPNNRFGNFGALGAAWIFSDEPFMSGFKALSFGKLRGSYGTTGSDTGIGTYQYMARWASISRLTYGGQNGIAPSNIGNPSFQWEMVKKSEIALELGFLEDRLMLEVGFFRNISDNQLVGFSLASQTGFTSVTANLPAKVLNRGYEIGLTSTNIQNKNLRWTTSLNLTLPYNELLEFPDLENSSYSGTYLLGQPVTVIRGYSYQGVDPETGYAQSDYVNSSGQFVGNFATRPAIAPGYPKLFGGINNAINFKNWDINAFIQFTVQERSQIPIYTMPGALSNQGLAVLDRWQSPGDITNFPRLSTQNSTVARITFNNFTASDAMISDASFLRLKNLSIGYSFNQAFTNKLKLQRLRWYVQGQNLFTITGYYGLDPEVGSLILPPMRVVSTGVQVSF
ncbi:SusC/RagA family TonB-linked outer membrane protein [Belliella sp. DSM 111904]|uniref:SusC/RagA family TonB-linked outer membrane protein n=1 Tax=Belliella filtrata TaxID=2923435 RepID=A0ABS9UXM7_9BACT|nr:SusC/RagA family TonB-linked outer membrane protein [Belliella filtrata]MCH7408921.1 SusC/RagA family TonB-linked outer membrane protein [Belliella filtrata]